MFNDPEEARPHVATMARMEVSITPRPDATAALERLHGVLAEIGARVVACSGGIDSLLLSTVAHRAEPSITTIAHTVTPAVPGDGTARVVDYAEREGWNLELVRSQEFDDESYLANPVDRCYHCKRNLYDAVDDVAQRSTSTATVVLSGANLDDLGEYRPGLAAAAERAVRHPFVEAVISKAEVRSIARHLGIADAELPASPCLASRLYTGTRVTPARLSAIEAGEATIRDRTGLEVVRCRLRDTSVLVEVDSRGRSLITDDLCAEVGRVMASIEPTIQTVTLDDRAYAPGRAFVQATEATST